MPDIIRQYDNQNHPIIDVNHPLVSMIYFNIVKLKRNQTYLNQLNGYESVYVVLNGNCSINVNDETFDDIGHRDDIWSGKADSVYAPIDAKVMVSANQDCTIAIAGGICEKEYKPFRITPDEVEMVDVGSPETHSRRRIFHILGHNAAGRAGNLLVSELYCDGGCWSGYPPHKHDEDTGSQNEFDETNFQEVYYYQFNPENGFGGQFIFQPDGSEVAYRTKSGDTVIIEKGFHPTVTSPGHQEYIFTILVGKSQRSLIQNFKEEYRHLMDAIPGIGAMRDKFKQKS